MKVINKRNFKSLVKDYNEILGVYIGHLASGNYLIKRIARYTGPLNSQVSQYSIQLHEGSYLPMYRSMCTLKREYQQHATYGNINRHVANDFSLTIDNENWSVSVVNHLHRFAEPLGNLSNTCLFRHANVQGRRISIVNQSLPENIQNHFKAMMKKFSENMYSIYHKFYLGENSSIKDSVTGFIRGKSYVEHAKSHMNCKSAISVDISKFYDSISMSGIANNQLYYKSLCCSFKMYTGLDFKPESFSNSYHYKILDELFGLINSAFISLMNLYTHNGILPTGANYSPIISNILFAPMDSAILGSLSGDQKFTRYADDMCISTSLPYLDSGEFSLTMANVLELEKVVNESGFFLNYDKTCIMGPRDRKKIAGIIIDSSTGNPILSIGSAKKLKLKQQFEGKHWNSINASEKGTLEWVRSINKKQYDFVISGMADSSCLPAGSIKKGEYRPKDVCSPWYLCDNVPVMGVQRRDNNISEVLF